MPPRVISIGIHVPAVSETTLGSGAEYADYFRRIENLGLDSIWVEDRLFHKSNMLDGPTLLTWAAANTARVQLGTAVLLLNLRGAPSVARQASTLWHLSGGRLSLGVSLGGQPNEYLAAGVPMERRARGLENSIRSVRALLAGSAFISSDRSELEGTFVRPAARVPILLGGRAESALKRAGRLGDGWIMSCFGGLADFKRSWEVVKGSAVAAGRDPAELESGRLVYVAIDEDRLHAKERLSRYLHSYYGSSLEVDDVAIYGSPRDVAGQLAEYTDAGMNHLMLGVPDLDSQELIRIAEEVAPIIRGTTQ